MESMRVRQRVGQDGILHLEIPVGLKGQDIEVMVIYQPVQGVTNADLSLEEVYGICMDNPINIDEDGVSSELDEDLARAFD